MHVPAAPAATSKPSFGRTSCSPALDPQVVQGLAVAMPEQIAWGDPLPVCGHLKIGDELRISYPGLFPRTRRPPTRR